MKTNKLIPGEQYGFRQERSTADDVISVTHNWIKSTPNQKLYSGFQKPIVVKASLPNLNSSHLSDRRMSVLQVAV